MTRAMRTAAGCSVIAGVVAAVVGYFAAGDRGIGSLVRVPREEPIGGYVARLDPEFHFVPQEAKYDGRYFYAIALDPFARGEASELLDNASYRYGHPAHGWLARFFAAGRLNLVPWALLALSVAGLALAAGASSLIASGMGASGWLALTIAVNPGLLFAVSVDTAEAAAAGILALALLLWLRGTRPQAAALMVLLCLMKEPFVAVPLGLLAWEALEWRRGRGTKELLERAALLAAGPVALGLWHIYLRVTFGIWPFADDPQNLGAPIAGWLESLRLASDQATDPIHSQLGSVSLVILVALGTALLIGAVRAARFRSPMSPVYVLTVALLLFLTPAALHFPKDLFRNTWLALAFLPIVVWSDDGHMSMLEEKSD